jgi:hypothetical protein
LRGAEVVVVVVVGGAVPGEGLGVGHPGAVG